MVKFICVSTPQFRSFLSFSPCQTVYKRSTRLKETVHLIYGVDGAAAIRVVLLDQLAQYRVGHLMALGTLDWLK